MNAFNRLKAPENGVGGPRRNNSTPDMGKVEEPGLMETIKRTWSSRTPAFPSLGFFRNSSEGNSYEKREKKKEERENMMAHTIHRWNTEILPGFDDLRNSKRLKELIWLGVPPLVRGQLWIRAIGNQMHITKELYEIFRKHARSKAQARRAREEEERQQRKSGDNPTEDEGQYSPLSRLEGRESSVMLIELDLNRTFHTLDFFRPGGPYHDSLRNVLETYACYRPDVGYVQGMSYIASMLLLNMEEMQAFVCLANMLNKRMLMSFFLMEMPKMEPYMLAFDFFCQEYVPEIYERIHLYSLRSDMYLIDWFLTLFSKSVPLDVAARIWDAYLVYGDHILYRAGLAILKIYEPRLLNADHDELVQLLTKLPPNMDPDDVFKAMSSIDLRAEHLDAVLAKCSNL